MLQGLVQAAQQAQVATGDSGDELLHIVLPKVLEWPFLLFVALLLFWCLFGKELRAILCRGDILLSWGDRRIHLRELSKSLDEELDPIRDDIEELRRSAAEKAPLGAVVTSRVLDDDDMERVKTLVRGALEGSQFQWRSIERLAGASGVNEKRVLEIIRADPTIRLSIGKSGRQIAGLRTRVGD